MIVTIDFETFYSQDYGLKKLTTEEYVRDPQFEIIGVGTKVDDGPEEWMEWQDFGEWITSFDWSRTAILAHNAVFDGFILSHHYGVKPIFWLDTLSMARALHRFEVGGSLAKLMYHYAVGTKGDEVTQAIGKRRADFTDAEWHRYGAYCKNDTRGCWEIFQKMRPMFPEAELRVIDMTMRMFMEPRLRVDVAKAEAYELEEQQRKAALLARIAQDKTVIMSNDKFAQLILEHGQDPPKKMSQRTGKETWAFAKTDPDMRDLLEHPREEIRWLAEERVANKTTINETRARRLSDMGRRGPLPVLLNYAGAHTNRWSGGGGINPQNFQRGGTLRHCLLAPRGYVVVEADSSQIEARVLAWLAKHSDLVKAFAEKRDIYSEFASTVYGRLVTKVDTIERSVGKVSTLGLGYQMAWRKFAATLLAGPMGSPPIQFDWRTAEQMGVNIAEFSKDPRRREQVATLPSCLDQEDKLVHCAVSEHVVTTWRTRNGPIVQLWNSAGRAQDRLITDAAEPVRFGPVALRDRRIQLPSGLWLRYLGLSKGDNGHSYFGGKSGKERVKIYGGKLVENIVQALARDIIAEQAVAVSKILPVVTTTHDSIAVVAPKDEGQSALDAMLEIMRTPPAWAPGLPLNAEGGFGASYGEVKG